jgi:cytochrome c oxidase assembly protein subunit 15
VIEFGNRMVVFVLVVACGVTFVAALLRRPRRTDLTWLAGGLILGVIGEAVLGAFVVYSKLNPYVVGTHFMIGMGLLAVEVVLTMRAAHGPGRGTVVVTPAALWLGRAVVALLVVVLAAGAATTGTGPHAGGKGAKRIPLPLEDMTRIHAEIVITTVVVVLVLLWTLWRSDAPEAVQNRAYLLLGAMIVQGAIGYIQFFTHLPPVLVGVHVLGATLVWATALWFHHHLSDHPPEVAAAPGPTAPVDERAGTAVPA